MSAQLRRQDSYAKSYGRCSPKALEVLLVREEYQVSVASFHVFVDSVEVGSELLKDLVVAFLRRRFLLNRELRPTASPIPLKGFT